LNPVPGTSSPAGFWKRYVAYFIDFLLVNLVLELLGIVFFHGSDALGMGQLRSVMARLQGPEGLQNPTAALMQAGALLGRATVLLTFVYAAVGGAYFVLCESSPWQATLGKRLIGIKVTTLDGSRINAARAVGRFLAAALSWLTMNIGHALAAWTPERRALHDMIAGTRVENADPSRPKMPVWGWLIVAANGILFVLAVVAGVMVVVAGLNAASQA
jgi:uncharacterized RDD family membrane protein YckC